MRHDIDDKLVSMNDVIKIIEESNVNLDFNDGRKELVDRIKEIELHETDLVDRDAVLKIILDNIPEECGVYEKSDDVVVDMIVHGGMADAFADIYWNVDNLPSVKCDMSDFGFGDFVSREAILRFPIRKHSYDKEHGDEHFIFGIETVMEFVEKLPSGLVETNEFVGFAKDDVVQFNENHKWCGSLGIVDEVKPITNDVRYMVGVPMPMQGTAYIFVKESDNAIDRIGKASLVYVSEEENEEDDN